MNYRDLAYLQEAYYNGVHQLDELSSRTLHNAVNKSINLAHKAGEYDRNTRTANSGLAAAAAGERATRIRTAATKAFQRAAARKAAQQQTESYDFYDVVLDHLIGEGYADTYESAEAIMVNMSEDWVDAIIDEELEQLDEISQKTAIDAFRQRATGEYEYDTNPYDYTKSGESKAELAKGRIERKFGKAAGQHAERAAHASIFGRKGAGGMPPKPAKRR